MIKRKCYHTIHWHFIYLCWVVLLNITKNSDVIILHKVYGNTLSAKTTWTTDSETMSDWIIKQNDNRNKKNIDGTMCTYSCVYENLLTKGCGILDLKKKKKKSFLPVDVQLTVVRQVIVDDQWYLLHINTPSPNISGNEYTTVKKKKAFKTMCKKKMQ